MTSESFRLNTIGGLSLEAEIDEPAAGARAALVFCHPHPKMGGTMNAPLLLAVRDQLIRDGWAVLRFNFRGIGDSEGESSLGIDEVEDAMAAVDEAHRRFPEIPVCIGGWSFGAAVAVRVAIERDDLAACVAIAPAVAEKPGVTAGLPPADEVELKTPTHFIVGINDDLVEPKACEEWAAAAGATCTVMRGANHFFWGKYADLSGEVARFLTSVLEGSRT
jgi:alpha/beta superfamily hydrolase